jgi:hypothetical protein
MKHIRNDLDDLMKAFEELPPVAAQLTQSEEMRFTALCPTSGVRSTMPKDIPPSILQREWASTPKTRTSQPGTHPMSTSSTKLMTRAYTDFYVTLHDLTSVAAIHPREEF